MLVPDAVRGKLTVGKLLTGGPNAVPNVKVSVEVSRDFLISAWVKSTGLLAVWATCLTKLDVGVHPVRIQETFPPQTPLLPLLLISTTYNLSPPGNANLHPDETLEFFSFYSP